MSEKIEHRRWLQAARLRRLQRESGHWIGALPRRIGGGLSAFQTNEGRPRLRLVDESLVLDGSREGCDETELSQSPLCLCLRCARRPTSIADLPIDSTVRRARNFARFVSLRPSATFTIAAAVQASTRTPSMHCAAWCSTIVRQSSTMCSALRDGIPGKSHAYSSP